MTIRPVRVTDAEALYAMRIEEGVFENTLAVPSLRVESTENFLKNMPSNQHQLVAEVDGLVVGTIGFTVSTHPRRKHVASFGINVKKDYQGKGIGSKLVETMIDICDNWLQVHRIELGVYEDNMAGIALYKKYGFFKEGMKIDAAFRNGTYVNEIIMARIKGGIRHVEERNG